MALKDWDLDWKDSFRTDLIRYQNYKKRNTLIISKKSVIVTDSWTAELYNNKYKTKSQALKFAKSYMRTH